MAFCTMSTFVSRGGRMLITASVTSRRRSRPGTSITKTWLMRRPVRSPPVELDHRAQQLVAVEVTLHDRPCGALMDQLDRPGRGLLRLSRIDDAGVPELDPMLVGQGPDRVRRADQDRVDQTGLRGLDGPPQRDRVGGEDHRCIERPRGTGLDD